MAGAQGLEPRRRCRISLLVGSVRDGTQYIRHSGIFSDSVSYGGLES